LENARKMISDESASKISFQAYWKIFWRKKFYFIIPLVLSAAVSIVGVRHLTPIYESITMLSIEDKYAFTPTMERYVPAGSDQNQTRNQQFKSMVETRVKSNDFLRLVAEDLGLQRLEQVRRFVESTELKDRGELSIDELVMRNLVSLLKKKIDVKNPNPGFFTIGISDTDPSTAYILAEKVSQKFIDVTRQDQIQGIRQAGAFSDEQLAIYKEKLETSEKELERVKHELAESGVENNPVNTTNFTYAQVLKQTMDAEMDRNGIALKRVRDKLVQLLNLVPSSDKINTDATVRNCENKLVAFGEEKLLRDLSRNLSFDQQNPMLPDEFKTVTGELRNRIVTIVQAEYRNLTADVYPLIVEYYYQRSLGDYYALLNRRLGGYMNQFSLSYERKPSLERELNGLTQEVETNRAIYKAFVESRTSARISEAAQTTNLGLSMNIIERAEKPLAPVKPDPLAIIIVAILFGAACGLGAILLTEYLDDSFKSVEEVERVLKTPVLGTVPKMETGFAWEKERRGIMIVSWIVGVVLFVVVMSGALYLYANYLKSSGLGLQLKQEQPATEVQR
jgi:succinoglycan biosynthesis transport protein ExoP